MNEVKIATDFIKLDQFLKWAGVAENGGAAKAMVINGEVKVNGEIILQRGKKLYRGDNIAVKDYGEFTVV